MTIQSLADFGCDVQTGLHRCIDNETFYLSMVNKMLATTDLSKLKDALDKGDLESAFALTHSMKGVFGNLAITPIYDVLSEMTELLRARTVMDYSPLFEKLQGLYEKLKTLA